MRNPLFPLCLYLVLAFVSACDDGGDKNNNLNNANNVNNVGCTVGDEASATFDDAGGTLTLCGASVTVDAGALSTALGVTLRVVETPADAPYPYEAAGPAFEVITDGWQEVEACTANDEVIGQRMSVGGTYLALADTVDFPQSIEGMGSGTLVSGFQGENSTWDLDADEIDTYAIYNEGEDGTRGITLSATVLDGEGNLSLLNLKLGTSPDGEGGVLQIDYGNSSDPDGFWVYGPFEAEATFTIVSMEGETLQGSVTAEMTRGQFTETLVVVIDVTMELYRYPSELSCENAGG